MKLNLELNLARDIMDKALCHEEFPSISGKTAQLLDLGLGDFISQTLGGTRISR